MVDEKLTSFRVNDLLNEQAYEVLSKSQSLEREGKQIYHFEIGQPDFKTPENIVQAGIKAIQDGHTKYGPVLGLSVLRDAIAYNQTFRTGITVKYNQVAITPSGHTAIFAVMSSLINPGDEVIYPNPSFPAYHELTKYLGGVSRYDMRITPKTKLVILCSPSNPTGQVMTKEQMQIIASAARTYGIWVMTDEIYARLVYDNIEYPSYMSYGDPERTIVVDGFSKSYAMTGWRIGHIIAPSGLIDRIEPLLTHLTGGVAPFVQYAAYEALTGSQDSVHIMTTVFEKRRNTMVKLLNEIGLVTCDTPQGAFYCFPNVSAYGKSSQEIADCLLSKGVATLPGTAFGTQGEGYLRLSYATDEDTIKKGLAVMKEALERL